MTITADTTIISIPTHQIDLGYTCGECETEASQPLADIVSVGTLICPECGNDMELDTSATVALAAGEFIVTVDGCSQEQARIVMQERIMHDEDLGFNYEISYE